MEPVSLIAGATAAFKCVKALVEHGAEVEEVFGHLSRWATHASDLRAWCQAEDKKPSIFKKLSFGDSTSEAMNAVTIRMRLAKQETEIREMFKWYGPPGAYEDFIQERRRIEDHRKRTIYDQMYRRQAFIELVLAIGLLSTTLGGVAWLFITFI